MRLVRKVLPFLPPTSEVQCPSQGCNQQQPQPGPWSAQGSPGWVKQSPAPPGVLQLFMWTYSVFKLKPSYLDFYFFLTQNGQGFNYWSCCKSGRTLHAEPWVSGFCVLSAPGVWPAQHLAHYELALPGSVLSCV